MKFARLTAVAVISSWLTGNCISAQPAPATPKKTSTIKAPSKPTLQSVKEPLDQQTLMMGEGVATAKDAQKEQTGRRDLANDLSDLRNDTISTPARRSRILKQQAEVLLWQQKFNQLRDKFKTRQDELLRELRSASSDKKDNLREQIQAEREQWFDQQKELRQQFRDRLKEIRNSLHNDELGKVIDAAKDPSDRKGGKP